MKKRKVLIILATMVMGAMLIGCGSSKKDSSDDSKKIQTKESDSQKSDSQNSYKDETENEDTINEKTDNEETDNTTLSSGINDELAAIEQQENDIIEKVNGDNVTQMDMNEAASERYKLWDDELNSIWGRLEEKLSSSEMDKLREEQRTWIAEKEAAVENAGKEVQGGSIRPMIEADTAAELTKERVYELASMLE